MLHRVSISQCIALDFSELNGAKIKELNYPTILKKYSVLSRSVFFFFNCVYQGGLVKDISEIISQLQSLHSYLYM